MCPSNYNRFWDTARYWSKIVNFFHTPLAFDAPVRGGGSRWNSATPFGTKKLEWLGYHMVKKNFEDIFIRFGATHERTDGQTDRQTDGHRMPEISALCIASHGKNHYAPPVGNGAVSVAFVRPSVAYIEPKGQIRNKHSPPLMRLAYQFQGQRSRSPGPLMITHILRHIFQCEPRTAGWRISRPFPYQFAPNSHAVF